MNAGVWLGAVGVVAGLAAIQLDRWLVIPSGIAAADQAAAQSLRLNLYAGGAVVCLVVAIGCAIWHRRRRSQ